MTRDEWYRSPDWDDRARAAFESKLIRARPDSRPQYLRIKAWSMYMSGDPVKREPARDLCRQLIVEYPDSLEVPAAHEFIAWTCMKEGDRETAKAHLRETVRTASRDRSTTSGLADVWLVRMLVEDGELDEARERWPEAERVVSPRLGMMMPSVDFDFHLARAMLLDAFGEREESARSARWALEAAAQTRSGSAKHPDIGLAEPTENEIVLLERIARTGPSS
jgi:hypothetical protein